MGDATVAPLAPWLGEGGRSQPPLREPPPKSKASKFPSPPSLIVDTRSLACLPSVLEAGEIPAAAAGGFTGGDDAKSIESAAFPHAAFGSAHRRVLTEMG